MSLSCDCPLCNYSLLTKSLFLNHLRHIHNRDEDFFVTCRISYCVASYSNCASFVSHVYWQHGDAVFAISLTNPASIPEQSIPTYCCYIGETNGSGDGRFAEESGEVRTDLQYAVDEIVQNNQEELQRNMLCSS